MHLTRSSPRFSTIFYANFIIVLWHIDPLLGSSPRAKVEVLLEEVFSLWSAPRLYLAIDWGRFSFPWWKPVRDLHTAFSLPYVYDCMTELFRQQAEVVQNREKKHMCITGWRRNIRGLYLAVVKLTTVQATKLPLWHKISKINMICFAKLGLTQDLYTVQKQEFFSNMLLVLYVHLPSNLKKK
jgi:hypothetical protein